jgi:vancomycin resistance protein VanW
MKRYWSWYFAGTRFAKKRLVDALAHETFEHSSILLKRLKNSDMLLQRNKVHNLRLAIERLDGLIVEPGEVFSFWHRLGRPTASKGYKPGMVLFNGRIREGIGGGLCQLSNLIYWMTLHTGLTIRERWRHSFDVFPDADRTQPFGSGATCAYNFIDLQIENRSECRYQLKLWLSETHLHGRWLCDTQPEFEYHVFEANHEIRGEPWGGYSRHNELFRRVCSAATGEVVREEFIAANHALMMYDPMLPERSSIA